MVGNQPMTLMKQGMTPQMIFEKNYSPRPEILRMHMVNRRKLNNRPSVQRDIMLVGTTPPPGPNKPKRYLELTGYDHMQAIAEASRRFAANHESPSSRGRHNLPFVARLHTLAIMDNVTAFDGTHFALSCNVVLAQVFLNVLEWAVARA
jgi:hypothetical protein